MKAPDGVGPRVDRPGVRQEAGSGNHLIEGRTDRTAWGLARQLRRLVYRLADPTYRLPPAKNSHVAVDREGWVKLLRPRHDELEKLNRSLSRSGKASPTTNGRAPAGSRRRARSAGPGDPCGRRSPANALGAPAWRWDGRWKRAIA